MYTYIYMFTVYSIQHTLYSTYMHMYIYIYIYMYMCIYIYIYIYVHRHALKYNCIPSS